jgi:hypothetical protein
MNSIQAMAEQLDRIPNEYQILVRKAIVRLVWP